MKKTEAVSGSVPAPIDTVPIPTAALIHTYNLLQEEINKLKKPNDLTSIHVAPSEPPFELPESVVKNMTEDVKNKVHKNPFIISEVKKTLNAFQENLKRTSYYISYEGAAVLLVLVALHNKNGKVAVGRLTGLPHVDRGTIKSIVPEKEFVVDKFTIKLNKYNDFELTFTKQGSTEKKVFTFVNAVTSPRPEDLENVAIDDVKQNDEIVEIGGGLTLNKKFVKKVLGNDNEEESYSSKYDREAKKYVDSLPPSFAPSSLVNKNAYEIRLDVLKEAISFLNWTTECHRDKATNSYTVVPSPDDAINLAQKFYKFVENRR